MSQKASFLQKIEKSSGEYRTLLENLQKFVGVHSQEIRQSLRDGDAMALHRQLSDVKVQSTFESLQPLRHVLREQWSAVADLQQFVEQEGQHSKQKVLRLVNMLRGDVENALKKLDIADEELQDAQRKSHSALAGVSLWIDGAGGSLLGGSSVVLAASGYVESLTAAVAFLKAAGVFANDGARAMVQEIGRSLGD